MLKVKSKVWLEKNNSLVLGDGRFRILQAIDETGSINKAAKKLDMSFRHAWSYIDSSEKTLGIKLIQREKGGRYGGGSRLTPRAKKLVQKLARLNAEVKDFVDLRFRRIFT
ncbi:MAG: winged helix-turn-helix domain-containing protein [Candidatus Omnitrophica bacterium]|nr:winged helix-turn-helix domain-containing protein [Candidatus Omnitrophota bacterium]